MKLFHIDWQLFFRFLRLWESLPLESRQSFATLKANQWIPTVNFGNDLQPLIDAKVLWLNASGKNAKLHQNGLPLARVIRAMCSHPILASPNAQTLGDYLTAHFTNDQKIGLSPETGNYYRDDTSLIRHVMSKGWLDSFLELQSFEQAQRWEEHHKPAPYHPGQYGSKSPFQDVPVLLNELPFKATQRVIGQFVQWAEPVPFAQLPQRFKDLSLSQLATAITFGLRYLMLFATMRPDDMTPVLMLWPTITRRLHRPLPKPPALVKPDETFHSAFLMEDMTAFLVTAFAESLRVRSNDGVLFAKASQQVARGMTPLPSWLTQNVDNPQDIGLSCDFNHSGYRIAYDADLIFRLNKAGAQLSKMGLIQIVGQRGKDLRLEPNQAGQQWLAGSSKQRLKAVLDQIRCQKPKPAGRKAKRNKPAWMDDLDLSQFHIDLDDLDDLDEYYDDDPDEGHDIDVLSGIVPWRMLVPDQQLDPDLPGLVAQTFKSLKPDRYVVLSAFVDYHAIAQNPLIELQKQNPDLKIERDWHRLAPTVDELEQLWGELIMDLIFARLGPLGGVKIGRQQGQIACIAITQIGRYVLGLSNDFDYGHEQDNAASVVIQPNFEIVFLSASPQAEAALARFGQRVGQTIGTLFRITKQSIFLAAHTGMNADQVLVTLRSIAAKGIPKNVEHEIRHWFGLCRRVTAQPVVVVRCPDPETARRVLAIGGKKIKPLTDTMLELPDTKLGKYPSPKTQRQRDLLRA